MWKKHMENIKVSTSPLAKYLNDLFEDKKKHSANYTLRAFAQDLQISAGRLSEILSGKYALGPQIAEKMIVALQLKSEEQAHFWDIIELHNAHHKRTDGAKILANEELGILADYDHFSLLNLMETEDFESNPTWMAQRLGIPLTKLNEILDRLIFVGLVKVGPRRSYKPTYKKLTTTHDHTSETLQEAHRRRLSHALRSLTEVPIDKRDITSITFALDREQLPEAKELIRDFRRRMATLLEAGQKNEVYNLNIQLVPVTE